MQAITFCIVLLLVFVGITHTWWILFSALAAIMVCIYVCTVIYQFGEENRAIQATRAAIAARADKQHEQFMSGDPAGYYGIYKPADIGRDFF